MQTFLQLTIIGVAMGLIYSILACGLVLLRRATGLLNFAQGDLLMIGAYISYQFMVKMNMGVFPSIFSSIVVYGVIGLVFMFVIFLPVRNSPWPQATVVCTIGAGIILEEAAWMIWGSVPLSIKPLISGTVSFGNLKLQNQYFLIMGTGIVIVFLIFFIFEKLYPGKLMQATAQKQYAARLIGIPILLTIALTYMLNNIIVGLAGLMVAPVFIIKSSLSSLQFKAFAGAIVGGFGDLRGAVIGSIIIGLLESYSTYVTTIYKDAIVFAALIIVLIFRPQGIFKDKIADKA